ncbi:MAG: hypothetical protein ACTHJM_01830, partial [Marmoricola sp.]
WGYANSCNFTDEMRLDNSWVQNYINAFYPGTTALPNGQPTAYVNGVTVTRYFGTPNPSPLYSVSSIPTGTQGGAPAVSTKATKTSVPGVYPVTVSAGSFTMTGSFEAYAINLVNGAITVDRAPITVTVAKPTFLAGLAHLSAVVTNAAPGAKNAPVVGLPVTFSVTTSTGHTYSCKGKSNASGKASCSVLASAITTSGTTSTYTATVPASTDYLAGSGSASFTR